MRIGTLVVLLACGLTSCILDIGYDDTHYRCTEEPVCPSGYVCVAGFCEAEGRDASVTDAHPSDAASPDAAIDAAPPLPIGNLITFTFDDVSARVIPNRAGNRLVGAMSGDVVTDEGRYGKGLDVGSAVTWIPKDPALFAGNQVTIEAWLERTTDTGEDTVFSDRDNTITPAATYHVSLYAAGSGTRFKTNDGCEDGDAAVTSTATNIPAGVWTHLAVVWNGTVVSFYVDGELTESLPLVATPCYSPTTSFRIGRRADDSQPFGGLIDEVKLSNYAKSQDEIQTSMEFDSTILVGSCGDFILEADELCDNDTVCCASDSCQFAGDGTGCGSGTCTSGACDVAGGRVTDGLVALYQFDDGSGTTVSDTSGVAPALDLEIADLPNVTWLAGGLSVDSSTQIASPGAATKIVTACQLTNELTVEAWVKPANDTQAGPARVVTMSQDTGARNFQLGQDADLWIGRIRSAISNDNGAPYVPGVDGDLELALTHLVMTRSSDGIRTFYVNGVPQATNIVGGDFSTWDTDYRLALANEFVTLNRTWLGEYYLIAIYNRALSAVEVGRNYTAGE